MSILAVIPARYGSTRFPGKPLALLGGKPMIEWVWRIVSQVQAFDRVIVATDDDRIHKAVKEFGGEVMMTSPDHPSGTDRVWEVAKGIPQARFVFNIQGDDPLINPEDLDKLVGYLKENADSVDIVTMRAPFEHQYEINNANVVKVVTNSNHHALYFSRAPIPFRREDTRENAKDLTPYWRHVGIYGFTRDSLSRFVGLPISFLEDLEKLEQLRALEAGMRIAALPIDRAPIGVDSPEDLSLVESRMTQTSLL